MQLQNSTPPMSTDEAIECLDAITQTAGVAFAASDSMLAQVATFDEGRGWEVLGFPSLFDCLKERLSVGQSQLYQMLAAHRAKKQLSTGGIDSNGASVKALARLSKVPPKKQIEVFQEAAKQATGEQPTSGDIHRVASSFTRVEGIYSKERQAKGKTVAPVKQARYHKNCPTCSC